MTRGIAPDLTLRRFGHLVVLGRADSDAHGNALWSCKCDCGNEVKVRAAFLKRGQRFCTKQCPHHREHARLHLEGQKFGRLTAIEFLRMAPKGGKAIWRFECECGGATERAADNVLSGDIQSCGCLGTASRIKHGLSGTRNYQNKAHRAWAARNPGKVITNANRRRSDFVLRVPKWLTDEQWEQIEAVYREAARLSRETGTPHHVDHEIPLRGKTVSGLHVPWNLKAIPATVNLQKSRRFSDDVC